MTKKIIAIATALTISVWMIGPGVAQAVTAADLQVQIDALLAQLATLQSQLAGMGGGTGTVGTACTFTRALYPGITGSDVQCLQQYLNSVGHPVADSGAGSPGHETTYYGSLTQAAVAGWQTAKGVACGAYCGYFGPISQAKYAALQAGTGAACGNGTCEAGETNANCPADCTATTCGNGTCDTGETNATCPADCAATACEGGEGSFNVTISATPVSRTVNAGTGLEALGIDVTASTSSDITVGSIDFQATVTAAGVGENPGNFIKVIKVYNSSVSDANLVETFSSPVFSQDAAGRWHTMLSGVDMKVAKSTTGKVLIVIDTTTTIDVNRVVTVGTYPIAAASTTGIRGRDCSGIDSYRSLGATTRVLTVQQPGVATVTISQATDNPVSRLIKADVTNGVTTNETLLSLNAKATAGPAGLIRLEVGYATAAASAPAASIFYLYDGDTMVSSATPGATENGRATFENFVLPLEQDVTKNLKIKGNWAANAAFESGGAATQTMVLASTAANAAGGVVQRANGQQIGVVIAANIVSNMSWIAEAGLKFTLVSGTATFTPKPIAGGTATATGTIVFKVVPFGGVLIEPAYASGATGVAEVASGMLARIEAPWASGSEAAASGVDQVISRTLTSSLGAGQNVAEDQEVTVTVKMDVSRRDNTTAGAGQNIAFKVEDICYSVGGAGTGVCVGTTSSIANQAGGNLTDNWVTNSVLFTD